MFLQTSTQLCERSPEHLSYGGALSVKDPGSKVIILFFVARCYCNIHARETRVKTVSEPN